MNTPEQIIEQLGLQPHPEGGYYKETYRSIGEIKQTSLSADYSGTRNYATCIYFLLTSDTFSAFHRINQDEIWHFYDGAPIIIHMISNTGGYSNITIGRNLANHQVPQFVVPGGSWFAAEVLEADSYSLVGCTVSPGFSFEDFDLPTRNALIALYPQHQEIITRLTHR